MEEEEERKSILKIQRRKRILGYGEEEKEEKRKEKKGYGEDEKRKEKEKLW